MRRIVPALRRPFFLACAVFLALGVVLNAQALIAAQSSTQKQKVQKNTAVRKQTAAGTQTPVSAQDVYAQEAYTEKELLSFIESLPHFLGWGRTGKVKVYPVVNAAGMPDFAYTPEAAAKAQELGWEPRRFFCLLGRTAAALYLVEEGTDLVTALPPDMPAVTETEMALVRKHLTSILRAGAGGPPPSLSR